MLRRAPAATTSSLLLRGARFSTAAPRSKRRAKGLNLTQYVSPLLLRLHPDTVQRHSAALALENELAMKQLNQFLELASAGCNNDTYNARKQVLSMAAARADDAHAPIRFALQFHIPGDAASDESASTCTDGFVPVQYVIEVPGALVRRTLASSARPSSRAQDPSAAVQAPFAREWQRTTKRILQDLFQVAAIPLETADPESGAVRSTHLARWLAEDDTPERQHGVHVAAHNRAKRREHAEFDSLFHRMLTREKNIVFTSTTGLEDGPTAQHGVLMSLISERVRLPKLETPEQRQVVFHWLANFLLTHFMELRLHSLVWNKITLLVTIDESVETPQVIWDEAQPEDGMGVLIPAGMDADALVDVLYEHVEALEDALSAKLSSSTQVKHARTTQQAQHQRQRKKSSHFYSREVAAMFRKS